MSVFLHFPMLLYRDLTVIMLVKKHLSSTLYNIRRVKKLHRFPHGHIVCI